MESYEKDELYENNYVADFGTVALWAKEHDESLSDEIEADKDPAFQYFPRMTFPLNDDDLGAGAYGSVKKINARISETEVEIIAVKEVSGIYFDLNPFLKILAKKALTQEIEIYNTLDHVNILKFLGADDSYAPTKFFMEYATEGSLEEIILNTDIELPYCKAVNFALQVANGLEYLHSIGVSHGDLHAGNVLKTKNETLKICDFGCASTKELPRVAKGNPKIMAPEILRSELKDPTPEGDVWSFSFILWSLLSRKIIHSDLKGYGQDKNTKQLTPEKNSPGIPKKELEKIIKRIISEDYRPRITPNVPKKYGSLNVLCWKNNPSKRPKLSYIVKRLEQEKQSLQASKNNM